MPILFVVLALLLGVSPAIAQADGDFVVATVNGTDIRLSDIKAAQGSLPARFQGMELQAVFGLLVSSLIDSKLVSTQARKQGLKNDAEVKRQMARIEDQILERIFIARYINARITDTGVKKRYDRFVQNKSGVEEIRARHILFESEAEARAVIKSLNDGGDFAELAKQHSTGPSASSGGDLGYFSSGQMVPEFSAAAGALAIGGVTENPVKTQFGWHVIKLEDRRQVTPPSFKESENDIRMSLSSEIANDYLQELRGKAEITRYNLDGSEMKDGN
ncbi:MAG: peptidylprolyl isomerase [Alphaproteobacteria bacterium]